MEIFLMIVDVLICLGLIVVILMQSSKSHEPLLPADLQQSFRTPTPDR